ncbi:MAG: MoaD family protein [Chloroflexi bacterium]|nr:MoaD family protein [Chloroflexota bacterium]
MAVQVRVTAVFQKFTKGAKTVKGQGQTIGQLVQDLERRYPGFAKQLLNPDGSLHQFVNIYLNDEDIRFLGNLDTPVSEGDVVSILPALSGGAAPLG